MPPVLEPWCRSRVVGRESFRSVAWESLDDAVRGADVRRGAAHRGAPRARRPVVDRPHLRHQQAHRAGRPPLAVTVPVDRSASGSGRMTSQRGEPRRGRTEPQMSRRVFMSRLTFPQLPVYAPLRPGVDLRDRPIKRVGDLGSAAQAQTPPAGSAAPPAAPATRSDRSDGRSGSRGRARRRRASRRRRRRARPAGPARSPRRARRPRAAGVQPDRPGAGLFSSASSARPLRPADERDLRPPVGQRGIRPSAGSGTPDVDAAGSAWQSQRPPVGPIASRPHPSE